MKLNHFQFGPQFLNNGLITYSDVLSSVCTISFVIDTIEIAKGVGGFNINGFNFIFYFAIENNIINVRRNDTIFHIPLDSLPQQSTASIFLIWTPTEIQVSVLYQDEKNKTQKIIKTVQTAPTVPPQQLIKWVRSQDLIPNEDYNSEEEFRMKIQSCLLSIQDKIDESGAINQFWNVVYEKGKIKSRTPKKEIEVQPIIHCLLSDQMLLASIEIIPELKTGVGNLDFSFIGKVKNLGFCHFCIEFKNAHSKKLNEGLLNQLPGYMLNKKATYGAYCILNYYGEWFTKPKNSQKDFYSNLIMNQISSRNPTVRYNIRVIEFILSKPITASKM